MTFNLRNKVIIKLRRQGKTHSEIGKEVGLSYERVRQLLNEINDPAIHIAYKKARLELRKIPCVECGELFVRHASQKHCSLVCCGKRRRKRIGGKLNPYRKNTKEYDRWRYKMVKKFKPEVLKKYWRTNVARTKADPKRYARFLKYQKKYYSKT